MAFIDTALVVIILLFILFLVWSRVQHQKMVDTWKELIEIMKTR